MRTSRVIPHWKTSRIKGQGVNLKKQHVWDAYPDLPKRIYGLTVMSTCCGISKPFHVLSYRMATTATVITATANYNEDRTAYLPSCNRDCMMVDDSFMRLLSNHRMYQLLAVPAKRFHFCRTVMATTAMTTMTTRHLSQAAISIVCPVIFWSHRKKSSVASPAAPSLLHQDYTLFQEFWNVAATTSSFLFVNSRLFGSSTGIKSWRRLTSLGLTSLAKACRDILYVQ
jgi:hypothetical protein